MRCSWQGRAAGIAVRLGRSTLASAEPAAVCLAVERSRLHAAAWSCGPGGVSGLCQVTLLAAPCTASL